MSPEVSDSPATLAVGCKVNLLLRITGRRADGYHTLESIFWPLASPSDTLTVTRASHTGIQFSCNDPALATQDNIVVKAYNAFAKTTSFSPGLSVSLQKNIPYGAGLGGGSADAATLLLHLNTMAASEGSPGLSPEALGLLGARLGADVPFFLHNTPCMVRGIGESIEPLPCLVAQRLSGIHLVLVCPRVHVATAWAFAAWDEKYLADALTNGNEKDSSPHVRGVCIRNDLCRVVFDAYPGLGKIYVLLQNFGAEAASMSGSGASVFGLFECAASAEKAVHFFHDTGESVFHHIL
jgi:4-diphosphocytidyl-2C-methyl-D-erythritol kinase